MRLSWLALAVWVGAFAAPLAAHAGSERRTAVIVGEQHGGEGTVRLRYAVSDADRIHRILTTIGGVAPEDATLLHDASASEVLAALDEADRKAAGGVLLFYFSGHAKDGELRLGDTRLPLAELRTHLGSLSARVKIAILDSCKSGELIRAKGGRVGPPFEVTAEPSGPRGLVVLASSAADEDSQESDLLGASFFTHYLASGLLGDADASNDGKVSLQEAYDYAYARTVAETAEARAGLQHPTYSYSLAGAGDIWLTDLTRADAMLVLPAASSGAYVIVNAQRRTLVAEVAKEPGRERRVALPAGTYEVKRRDGGGALFARIKLSRGDALVLSDSAMSHVALARNLSKGALDEAGDLAMVRPVRWTVAGAVGGQLFFAGATRTSLFPNLPLAGVEVESRDWSGHAPSVLAVDVSAGTAPLTATIDSLQVATRVTEWNVGASYLYELSQSRIQPYIGGRLSVLGMSRSFSDTRFAPQALFTMAPGVVAGVNVELTRHFSLGLRARANYLLYQTEDNLSLGFADLGLLARWEL